MKIPKENIEKTFEYISSIEELKLIHFRDLNKVIDVNNFQICTKVDFKEIKVDIGKNAHWQWNLIKSSHNMIYNFRSKTGSKYMIDDDNNIYRLSNHWGAVASCEWTLEGRGELRESVFISGEWEIGVANLKDFQIFRRKISRKKDIIINPEWKLKISIILPIVNELNDLIHNPEFSGLDDENKAFIGQSYGKLKHIYSLV